MKMIQLDFFESDDFSYLRAEVQTVKSTVDKVRKGTYARINALEKELEEVKLRLAIIEKNICKEDKIDSKEVEKNP